MTPFCPDEIDFSTMVHVPAGEFSFGVSDADFLALCEGKDQDTIEEIELDLEHALSLRRVYVEEFWIDRTPVTYQQYHQFIQATGYLPSCLSVMPNHPERSDYRDRAEAIYLWHADGSYAAGLEDKPAVFVSWYDALAYCEWSGKTLPTEIEWEKAARGSAGFRYPWGNAEPTEAHCNCNFTEDLELRYEDANIPPLRSVYAGELGKSPYGCLDMVGNAYEWCWNSLWIPDVKANRYGELVSERYLVRFRWSKGVIMRSADRAMRGGDRLSEPPVHVCAAREEAEPWLISPYVGFRCVWYPSRIREDEPKRHWKRVSSSTS
ncbi:hypothetical protein CTKA_01734 [Chthonomonas calidirosea]|uniref:Uncharacterized conserved protein n=1 Tax=Chthonomonas calidirosea (strain DSM 23976 / ICMP 18418 / T49) TaxID=1303518 RepID=S0EZY3_CHTCT|nr:SUMF1/EgtB/PvdO family nonheme iron enzyme [Chthonomonas calidirosea]CCW36166.1 Uncharacterized conserved protein [Chthonomonas calidirosea T49]CEK18144.1 hypothetical protein CTKA_01734 [Chthonomonas calidirosea]